MIDPSSQVNPQPKSQLSTLLTGLFEHAPALVIALHGPEHIFTYANPAYRALTGNREIIGRSVNDALPELREQGFIELLDRTYQTAEPYRGSSVPTRFVQHDGSEETRFFDFVYQPIFGECGAVEGIFGQGSDVTDRVLAERALRESEARFAAIFGQVSVGIAQIDFAGRFLLVNDRFCDIVGRSRAEVMASTMPALTHPDDLPHNLDLLRTLIAEGAPFVIEKRYLRGDGKQTWVRNHVSLVRAPDGSAQYITAVSIDINAERVARHELEESQARSAAILGAALDSIITIDEHSKVQEWNPTSERLFGYSREEALGRDLAELIIPPELRSAHYKGMSRFLTTGAGPVIGNAVEVEAVARDGRRIPVELAINPITLGGRRHFTAYLRDLTARRAAERALAESEQRLKATYEHAFVGIGEVNRSGKFLRVNEQFTTISGYSREELLARTIWDITHPDDARLERQWFDQQMEGGLPVYSLEKRYATPSSNEVWVELAASVVTDNDGHVEYGVRVVRDITDRKRLEERQRLLINELNHRVKNTLATVQSIFLQTTRGAADPSVAYATFADRLMALSRAHNVLTEEQWRGADFTAIVQASMHPFGSNRFTTSGPAVWLLPAAALPLALALHELATNAAKYGALSAHSGAVDLTWRLEDRNAVPHLIVDWREHGGPPVSPPQGRGGFGTRLLKTALAGELRGQVDLVYDPAGLFCRIVAPVAVSSSAHQG